MVQSVMPRFWYSVFCDHFWVRLGYFIFRLILIVVFVVIPLLRGNQKMLTVYYRLVMSRDWMMMVEVTGA